MAKCIAVVNQKGGVAKTTTAVNLAASLAFYSQETLLVDLDPQANATSGLGFDKRTVEGTVYNILLNEKSVAEVVRQTSMELLDMIPSHIDLIGAEVELVNMEGRENLLKNRLKSLGSMYRFIILDCPPSLGLLTLNALCAADSVLIPTQCEYYAMEGLSQLLDTIHRVKQMINPRLEIEGVLATMVDSRAKLTSDVLNEIKKVFKEKVYEVLIPRNVRLAESPSFGKPVLMHEFASRGAQTYLQLAREFLNRNGTMISLETQNQETAMPLQPAGL